MYLSFVTRDKKVIGQKRIDLLWQINWLINQVY